MPNVAKLSQPFSPVREAEDKDLIFSSESPLLKEEASGTIDSTFSGSVIYRHGLNYHPFFVILKNDGSGNEMELGFDFGVDDEALYAPSSVSMKYSWALYRLPLYKNFLSEISADKVTTPALYDSRFVLKVAKKDKTISSDDLRDFTIHSRARSPLIHQVDAKVWNNTDTIHSVTPAFSYNPICFGFAQVSGRSYNLPNGGQAVPYLARRNKTISITSDVSSSARTSLIVFKDPFIAPKVIEVRY